MAEIDVDRLNEAIARAEAGAVNANAAAALARTAAGNCDDAVTTLSDDITDYFNDVDIQTKRRLTELAQMASTGVLDITVDSVQLFEDFCQTTGWSGTYEQFLWLILETGGGSAITVDSAMSSSSENPVQNKVIKNVVDTKQDMLEVLTLAEITGIWNNA